MDLRRSAQGPAKAERARTHNCKVARSGRTESQFGVEPAQLTDGLANSLPLLGLNLGTEGSF